MPLTAAASSVKELAPFTMMLNKFNLDRISVLFEEPEAHLHPQRQQHVADAIGYAISKGCHMQITTHSDYFIKRLNLLIRLYQLVNKPATIEINELLNSIGICMDSFIDPTRISAYHLVKRNDGTTMIEEFNVMEEGMIPFTSFHKAIMREFNISSKIDEIFAEKD